MTMLFLSGFTGYHYKFGILSRLRQNIISVSQIVELAAYMTVHSILDTERVLILQLIGYFGINYLIVLCSRKCLWILVALRKLRRYF